MKAIRIKAIRILKIRMVNTEGSTEFSRNSR